MIMAGDFNCVTGQLDVEENFRNKRSMEMIQMVQTFNLRDFFREERPIHQGIHLPSAWIYVSLVRLYLPDPGCSRQ